jgi:hypothetical protein
MRPEPPLEFHPSRFSDLPLDLLIDRIDGGLGDEGAYVIRLQSRPGGVQFGFAPLGDDHPVDVLLGHRAPPEVDALGVAVSGTAHAQEPDREPDPAPDGRPEVPTGRVRVVQLHARDGRAASRVRRVGTDPPQVVDTGAAEGDVADCLRRALGLPTAPPPGPPIVWWAVDWLDAVLDHVCREPGRAWTWGHVAALHPLSGPLPPDRPSALVEHVSRRAAGIEWAAVRRAAAVGGGREPVPGGPIGPELAAWMDDGMFARWLLGSRPDPVDVVVDLVDLLPAPVTRGVVEALQAWRCW